MPPSLHTLRAARRARVALRALFAFLFVSSLVALPAIVVPRSTAAADDTHVSLLSAQSSSSFRHSLFHNSAREELYARILSSGSAVALSPAPFAGVTYYSQGSLAPDLTTSWNTLPGGGGVNPPNFTGGDIFIIQNGHNMATSGAWSVSGSGSQLIISNGGTLTASSTVTLAAATFFQIAAGGTYIHSNAGAYGSTIFAGTESFDAASTVTITNSNTTGPSGVTFGNLTVSMTTGTGSVNCSGGLTSVAGNLTVTSTAGFEFRLSTTNPYTLTIGGNLTVSGGVLNLSNGSSTPSTGGPFTVNIGGNFTQSGSGGFLSSNTGVFPTVVFTGGISSATFSGTGSANSGINWQVASGKTLQLNSSFPLATGRSMTVNSGGVLINTNFYNNTGATTTINGEFRFNGGVVNGSSLIYGSNGTLSFNSSGSPISVAPGQAYWPSFNSPKNVTVMGAGISAVGPLPSIPNTLTLSAGPINNASLLTLGNGATISRENGNIASGTPSFGTSVNVTYTGSTATTTGTEIPTSSTILSALTVNNTGGVTLGSNATINGASSVGSGAALNTGAFTLTLNNTLTNNGTFNISSGGTLKGTGTVTGPTTVASGATVAPGLSPGVLTTGDISFTSGSTFNVEINGTTVGTDYDQLNVAGTVAVGGASLNITLGFTPAGGNAFTIINNDNADAVSGTFAGLNEGSTITVSGTNFTISYVGGTGNDVVLTAQAALKYRSKTNGNWNDFNTWETSPDGTTWTAATSGQTPTSSDDTILIQTGHTVTVTANVSVDQVTVDQNGAISVNSGVTYTIADGSGTDLTVSQNAGTNGVLATAGAVVNNGQSQIDGTCRINEGGAVTGNALVYGSFGGLTYSGTSAQTTTNIEFPAANGPKTLRIDNGGGVTLHAARTVAQFVYLTNGTFTIGANLSLSHLCNITRALGSFSGTPTFLNQVFVTYTGGGDISTGTEIPSDPNVIRDLVSTNPTPFNITMTSDITVNQVFLINGGTFITGSNVLTMKGSVSQGSGWIIGNAKRPFTSAENFTFPVGTINGYSPLAADVTAGTGDLTVKATQSAQPNILNPAKALSRYWTVTEGGALTANLTFAYLDPADIPVTATESNFVIQKYDGSFTQPGGSVNTGANTATINGVTDFSDWTLAEPAALTLKYRSKQTGNWNNFNTWETSPDGTTWTAATSGQTPTSADDTITIRDTHTVSVTASVSADQLTVESGGVLNIGGGGVTLTIDNGTGTDLSINRTSESSYGLVQVADGDFLGGTGTISVTGELAIDSTNATDALAANVTNPNLTLNTGSTVNFNGPAGQGIGARNYYNLTFSNNAKTLATSGTIGIAGTFTPGTSTSHSINFSTIEYNGTSAQSLPSGFQTYENLRLNNSAGTSGFSGLKVNDTLTVQSGTFTSASDYHHVVINFGAILSLSGPITVSGDWTNNGTFTHNNNSVTFDGTGAQTITPGGTGAGKSFAGFVVNKASGAATLAGDLSAATVTVNAGTFDQGSSFNVTTSGSGTVATVGSSGTWTNLGTGDLTLSGNVSNAGTIEFNGNGTGCNELATNDLAIASTGAARTWSGTGTFSMTDVTVSNQSSAAPLPPVIIFVNSGTNGGGNTGWTFVDQCTAGTYTWIGGTLGANTDWQVATNWNPTRVSPAPGDVLIFDGNSTPAPTVTNVPTQTISSLQLTNSVSPASLNASAVAAPHTLTITGNAGLSVASGSRLELAGSNGLTIAVTTGTGSTISGTINFKGGPHRLTGANVAQIAFASGSIFTAGTTTPASGFTGHPFGQGTNDSVRFQDGSNAFFNEGSDPFGGAGKAIATFSSASNQEFNASTAWSAEARSYGNLTLSGNQTYFDSTAASQVTVMGNLLIASGSTLKLSDSADGDLNLWGNFTDNGTFDPNGRTVKFQGAGLTQTISKSSGTETFFNVLIAKTGGSVQLLSPLTISGALQFGGLAGSAVDVLELNGQQLTLNGTVGPVPDANSGLKGDLLGSALIITTPANVGTIHFIAGAQSVSSLVMNGHPSQTIATFDTDLTVGRTTAGTPALTLTNGIVDMSGSTTLTVNSNVSVTQTNGCIYGNEQRRMSCSGSCGPFTFHVCTGNGFAFIDETITTTMAGSYAQTVKAVGSQHPNITGVNALQTYWTLSSISGPGSATADVTFRYNDAMVPGSANESNFKIFRYNGSFTQFEPNALDTTNNFATLNSVSQFSDWTLAEAAAVQEGTLQFSAANYNDTETNAGSHSVTITVQRVGGDDGAVSVQYAVTDGTATIADSDYSAAPASGTLNWADGDSADKTFTVTVNGDTTFEPDETVTLTLSAPTGGATIGGTNPATLTIQNDDAPPCVPPATVYVDDDWVGTTAGADPDGGGPATNFGCDSFATIQGGVDGVTNPGTVVVNAGTYTETVTVNKQLSIRGAQFGVDARTRGAMPESIVNAPGGSFILLANGIALDGFTVQDATGTTAAGILTDVGSSGYAIRNNIIKDNRIGLYLRSSGATQTVVEKNLIRDNNKTGGTSFGNGLFSNGVSNALIENNLFAGMTPTSLPIPFSQRSLHLASSSSVLIKTNEFSEGNGVWLSNVDASEFSGNALTGTQPVGGTNVAGLSIQDGTDNLLVSQNTFTNRGNVAAISSGGTTVSNLNVTITLNTVTHDVTASTGSRIVMGFNRFGGTSNITENTITLTGALPPGAKVHGMDVSGSTGLVGTVNILRNTINGGNTDVVNTTDASVGIAISPGGLGGTPTGATINVNNNFISGWINAVSTDASGFGATALLSSTTVAVTGNDLSGNANKNVVAANSGPVFNASANWHGSAVFATVQGKITGTTVDYTPYLNVGTDTAGTAGFQGDFSSLTVHASGAQFGTTARIQEGIVAVTAGGTVKVLPGTYTGNVDATVKSVILSAGASPGQVTITGSFTLNSDDTLPIEIDGLSAATQYDNFIVNGAPVTLGNATLLTSGTHTPLPGQQFMILNNDGADAIVGTFNGLPEGAAIPNFLGSGRDANISYVGGDGNDVVLTVNTPVFTISDETHAEGNAGTTTYSFTVTKTGAGSASVNFETQDGTALTSDSDYQANSGTLNFAAADTSMQVTVLVNGDTKFETDESFNVRLSSAVNANIGDADGTGTITNDDTQPTISIDDVTLVEGNAGTTALNFTISLSNPSYQTITVNAQTADDSATTADSDYAGVGSTVVTFNPGQTSQQFQVLVNGDTKFELNEQFFVNLTGAANATILDSQGVGTISNDDTQPTISINNVTMSEGDSGTTDFDFTVSLSNASYQTITVNAQTADDTATTADSDYTGVGTTLLTFSPNTTTQQFHVFVNGDTKFELNDQFFVNLSGATNATILDNQGVGTITNDDSQPTISINSPSQVEGDTGEANLTFTVSLSNPSYQTITVNYASANGSTNPATGAGACGAGIDYVNISGGLTFNAGETSKPVDVPVCGDAVYELNETLTVTLDTPTNSTIATGTGTGTINNDDAAPSITINNRTLNEGTNTVPVPITTFTFTLTKTGPTELSATVNWATADGTTNPATGGGACGGAVDYITNSGVVTFPASGPGSTTQTVTVNVCRDATFEPNETFFVNLSGETHSTLADNQGLGTITNDDSPGSALVVNTTDDVDNGVCDAAHCSLREAINAANTSPSAITINFAIPASDPGHFYYTDDNVGSPGTPNGTVTLANVAATTATDDTTIVGIDPDWAHSWWSIVPATVLPTITPQSVAVNGYSQCPNPTQCAQVNTASSGTNAVLRIELNGNAGAFSGLSVAGGTSSVNGLVINRFGVNALNLSGSGKTTSGNFLGTDVSGTLDLGNVGSGVSCSGGNHTIGGSIPDAVNLISGNNTAGIALPNCNSNLIFGNLIGTKANGTAGLGNSGSGISITGAGAGFNTIGGTGTGEANTIAFNGADGISLPDSLTGNSIRANSIHSNGATAADLGIDLGADGVTANDPMDPDTGPNKLQNFPIIRNALAGTPNRIRGTLNSGPNQTYTIDLHSNPACDTSGNGEGKTYLGSTTADTDANGDALWSLSPTVLNAGEFVTATATDSFGNTSEFSACFQATALNVGTLQFVSAPYTDGETNADHTVTVTVSRTGGSNLALDVNYATSDGTATVADNDYVAASGTLHWNNGETGNKTFTITVKGDTIFEGDETVNITLSNPTNGATISGTNPTTLTITNDDPQPTLSINDVSLAEGNAGTTNFIFTVTKANHGPVSVNYQTQDGTATLANNDYQSTSGSLSWTALDTTAKTITVLVNGDTTPELNEVFNVLLSSPTGATISDDTGVGTILNDDESVGAGQLIISEFRFSGPGAMPLSSNDEFIELYNNTGADLFVTTTDGSAGWAVATSSGAAIFFVPNGTTIPARGHYLGANSAGYSLGSYATPDITWATDYSSNTAIAVFRTNNAANFNTGTRLDSVGPNTEGNPLYKEGTGYAPLDTPTLEHTFFRQICAFQTDCPTPGRPRDTQDNAADFIFADTAGTATSAGQRLGSPGPENLASPIKRDPAVNLRLLDATIAEASAPNRDRNTTSDTVNASQFGTMTLRRRVVNQTGGTVTRLRFRVIEMTTHPSGVFADLRLRSSSNEVISSINDASTCASTGTPATVPCTVNVNGLTLEQPPNVAAGTGAGTNSTVTLTLPGGGLPNGESINVQFLLGVQKTGQFKFYLVIEALP